MFDGSLTSFKHPTYHSTFFPSNTIQHDIENESNISSNIVLDGCWMKCWTHFTESLQNEYVFSNDKLHKGWGKGNSPVFRLYANPVVKLCCKMFR